MVNIPALPLSGQQLHTALSTIAQELADLTGRTITWDNVTGKPTVFTPATHQHQIADVTGLQIALNDKADKGELPTTEQMQDLVAALFQTGTHTNIVFEYDDANARINLTGQNGGVLIPREDVEDIVGSLIQLQGTGLSVVYDDENNVLRIALVGEVFTTAHRNKLDGLPGTLKTVGGESLEGDGDIPFPAPYNDDTLLEMLAAMEARIAALEAGGNPVDPVLYARAASLASHLKVHSGHSLVDTYVNTGEAFPGFLAELFQEQFGEAAWVFEGTDYKDTIPGSPMSIRWNDASDPRGAVLGIARYQSMVVTEGGPPFRIGVDSNATIANTLLYAMNFAENAYRNGNSGAGAESILWSIWPNTEGWIGYPGGMGSQWTDLGGFRAAAVEYGRTFRYIADYVTWKMHQLHPELPASWRMWLFPGHAWWVRVYDDIQAGLVPGIDDHRDLFRDDIHPNDEGDYAMAVFIHTLQYQTDARALSYRPTFVSAELDTYFKRVAWEVARSEECTGMGGTANATPVWVPAVGDLLPTYSFAGVPTDPVDPTEPGTVERLYLQSAPVEMDGVTAQPVPLTTNGAPGAPLYVVLNVQPEAMQGKARTNVFQLLSTGGEAMLSLTYATDMEGFLLENALSGGNHAFYPYPAASAAAGAAVSLEMWIDPAASPSGTLSGSAQTQTTTLTASTGTAEQVRYGTPDWGGEVMAGRVNYLTVYQGIPNATERADLMALADASVPVVVEDPANGTLWVGAFDENSVTLTASLVDNVDQIRIAATPVGGGIAIVSDPLVVDEVYNFARTTIAGLQADTQYDLQMRTVGGTVSGLPGRVRTRAAVERAFKIAFSSCFWAGAGNNHTIFETITDQNPDLLAFYNLGDRGYPDINTNNVALYHNADNTVMGLSRVARLHRTLPNLYMWDDHDFGPNDSNASSAGRPAALAWFRSRVPMRPHLTGALDAPYYTHSPMPGVTVAMLDTRSERNVGGGLMISAAQEAWLVGIIQAVQPGDVLVINSSVPWIATAAADTWSIAPTQRQRIADAVNANCRGQVLIIAGDMHALAFDDGTNSVGGIPVAQAAPLGNSTSSKGGPYTVGPIQATQHQYGTLDFTPTASGWSVRYEGWSVDDAGVQTRRIDRTVTLEEVLPPAPAAPEFSGTSAISGSRAVGSTLTADAGAVTGVPAPGISYQWFVDGILQAGATGNTFVRPSIVGAVPSVQITLDNDVEPNAVRIVEAEASTAAPAPGTVPTLVQVAMSPQDVSGQVATTTITFAQPQPGSLLVAMFGSQSTSVVLGDIAGWNVASYHIGTGFRHKAYWKIAGANEPTTVTLNTGASPRSTSGQMYEFANAAGAYNILVDTDGSLTATTGLDLGPHQAVANAISIAFQINDVNGSGAEVGGTGPGAGFTSRLNARPNARQRFGERIHTAAETVAASFTLEQSVRSGRTLLTFNPVQP